MTFFNMITDFYLCVGPFVLILYLLGIELGQKLFLLIFVACTEPNVASLNTIQ